MGACRRRILARAWLSAFLGVAVALLTGLEASDRPKPGDDLTYRPTVMIRRAKSLGSGTVIASTEGETLVLTASHVVAADGPIFVELYRYNLGVEHVQAATGYPRRIEASLVARDVDTDLAILRIRRQLAFPYVAKVGKGDAPPAVGTKVTSIGFDGGAKLIGFSTKVRAVDRTDLGKGGGFRPFVVTQDPPEHGRSGGGLFLADGSLVGVCIGRADHPEGGTIGLFSTLSNVRDLIRADEGVAASMARVDRRRRAASK